MEHVNVIKGAELRITVAHRLERAISKGQPMENSPSAITSSRGLLLVLLVGMLLVGLPVAVWFDLRNPMRSKACSTKRVRRSKS